MTTWYKLCVVFTKKIISKLNNINNYQLNDHTLYLH